ncbi:MAG TPA: fluoride efflux transporter CrcB [Thiolinea sp.]|nr:fluoride efflux transporter CrcB [Thiolinea sp.]
MWKPVLAISIGAAGGALLRWQLSLRLNNLFPLLPPGTLLANLLGGYLIGLALAFFSHTVQLPQEWRLLLITGFCGSLTTFSTFSAEVTSLLQGGRPGSALLAISVHVLGSLLMTFAGIMTWEWLRR